MNRFAAITFCIASAPVLFLFRTEPVSQDREKRLINLSEEKIDVGIEALTRAKEIYPDVNVKNYSLEIDKLADQVRRLAGGTTDPDQRIRCLNTVLFLENKFHGNRDSAFRRKTDLYYLNRVLDSKQGNCFSMPLLYVAVAQRLGWPVYLVHVPDHSFVRYVDPHFKEQNIEATSGGGFVPDEQYARDFAVSEKGRECGAYLRTLTHRELLGDLVAINAITLGHRAKLDQAITYLKLAVRLNPRLVDAWANLANAYKLMAKNSRGSEEKENLQRAKSCSEMLLQLGFVNPKDVHI